MNKLSHAGALSGRATVRLPHCEQNRSSSWSSTPHFVQNRTARSSHTGPAFWRPDWTEADNAGPGSATGLAAFTAAPFIENKGLGWLLQTGVKATRPGCRDCYRIKLKSDEDYPLYQRV